MATHTTGANSTLDRYTWEDAQVKAQAVDIINNGDLLVSLKLAAGVNWKPKGPRRTRPGLYWANESAFNAYGVGRSTYFKHRKSLIETGFWTQISGNLCPSMPEASLLETIEEQWQAKKSHWETQKSTIDSTESTLETSESLGDNPLSEDLCSEDLCSEDSVIEDMGAAAPAPSLSSPSSPSSFGLTSSDSPPLLEVDTGVSDEVPQSPVETARSVPPRDHRWSVEEITSRVDELSMRGKREKTDYYYDRDDVIGEASRRVEDGYVGDLDELLSDSLKVFAW